MFCKECGKKMPEDSKFCPECGTNNSAKKTVKKETKKVTKELTKEQIIEGDTKVFKIVSYIGILWILGLFCGSKNDSKVRFHVGQGIILTIACVAAGIVAGIIWKSSCGGNRIYIHHKINGVTYTTSYVHLRSILVSVGDTVTKDTKIAIMGGDPSVETWDKCSTGRHLHFATAYGLYLTDYTSWNTYIAKSVNPRTLVNFPQRGTRFTNRTTKY